MLETGLIFAAGFLTAGILALLILPSVNARAIRLVRRRLAAQFPISIQELTAQMDYIRAEGAVAVRSAERQLEKERDILAQTRAQLGVLESQARHKALADEAEISLLKLENARLAAELTTVTEERDTKAATVDNLQTQLASVTVNKIVLRPREKPELLNVDQISEVQRENASLRERIVSVTDDIIALTMEKPAATKDRAPAA